MSIILNAIFDECEKHFEKPSPKYYSCLHRTANGAGYIIIQRHEWDAHETPEHKKHLIKSRLHSLETIINKEHKA